ncbi:MAG: hypothetical protein JXA15_10965 [Spirochaetales bacterium]|nr:hypothetical protein [Spirochaetales bacterium]
MSSKDRKDSRHLGSEAELPPDRELEQYGVWVKSEPEDVEELEIERDAVDEMLPEIDDTGSLPEIGGLDPDGNRFLSADEERLLDSMDLPGPVSAFDDTADSRESELPELGSGVIDIELDELESAPRPSPRLPDQAAPRADADLEIFSPEDFGVELEAEGPSETSGTSFDQEAGSPGENAFEPIDIDLQFDDTIPSPMVSEGDEVSFDLDEIIPAPSASPKGFETVTEFDDFLGAEESLSPSAGSGAAPAAEAESVEIDLDSIGGAPSAPVSASASQKRAASADSLPDELGASDGLPELVLDETPSRDSTFDDLGALERDLASVPARAAAAESSDLLKRIAEDLAGIRGELVTLKRQLNELKGSGDTLAPAAGADRQERAGGFFDEEEDETIALTGDELDNILNTAAFTEETAEGEPVSAGDSASYSATETELLPEDGEYASSPAIEEIRLEPGHDGDGEPVRDDALDGILEEGIHPLTPALEDTAYLEESLEGEEPLELDAEPLEDTPLAEPDLDDFDLADEADILGSGEDLPVLEDAEDASGMSLEDIPFDVPAAEAPSPLGQDLDALETIPEIETDSGEDVLELAGEGSEFELPIDDFVLEDEAAAESEINLHEESSVPESFDADAASGLTTPESPSGSAFTGPASETLEEETFSTDADGFDELEPESEDEVILPVDTDFEPAAAPAGPTDKDPLRDEVRNVLSYLDKLLDSLPDDKIEEFARSEHFETYKRLFEELGLV